MYIADFHIHSKYSRATSKDMEPGALAAWAKLKGIGLMGTGDFTHPEWFAALKAVLREVDYGVYRYNDVDFILTTEVSNIYFKAGKVRKVHAMIFAPGFDVAREIGKALAEYGNLSSDGRPILKMGCDALVKTVRSIASDAFVVPGHIWTPHFSLFGANSGFDAIEECFEEETPHIYALETGLSSDPPMNWRWSKLDRFTLVSNSDAHSPAKIGREANVFSERIRYKDLIDILKTKDKKRFLYTIEFFPEEGKYHWDGHRACSARLSPSEAMKINNRCPRCGKAVTIGVLHRVESLADRPEGSGPVAGPSFRHVVPLMELIGEALGVSPDSVSVEREYMQIVKNCQNEFRVLLELDDKELRDACGPKIARAVMKSRSGDVEIMPGYDGEYGTVRVLKQDEGVTEKQLKFF